MVIDINNTKSAACTCISFHLMIFKLFALMHLDVAIYIEMGVAISCSKQPTTWGLDMMWLYLKGLKLQEPWLASTQGGVFMVNSK